MEDVEEKLRAILGDQGLGKLLGAFAAFDDNHDGRLSVKEASSSILTLLEDAGFLASKQLVIRALVLQTLNIYIYIYIYI